VSLGAEASGEMGRLLKGAGHRHEAAIAPLAGAAGKAADGLVYLAELDDARFRDVWPDDGHPNAAVNDSHVRWAATQALTSLDLCTAAAARLAKFAPDGDREVSVRDYYRVERSGGVRDERDSVPAPWRAWLDGVVADARYEKLLRVRNALTHADTFRIHHATTGPIAGHVNRGGYKVGPLTTTPTPSTHERMDAREIILLSRDVAVRHVTAFVDVLRSIA